MSPENPAQQRWKTGEQFTAELFMYVHMYILSDITSICGEILDRKWRMDHMKESPCFTPYVEGKFTKLVGERVYTVYLL